MSRSSDGRHDALAHRTLSPTLTLLSLLALIAIGPARVLAQDTANAVPRDSVPPSGEVTAPDAGIAHNASTPGAISAVASVGPASPAGSIANGPVTNAKGSNAAGAGKSDNSTATAPFSPFGTTQKGPVNIQSDGLDLDYKNNWVLFHGHVHAVQAGGELTSNSLRVKYGKDFSDMQQMIADGNVRISQGTRYATSDHAVLDQAVHTVTLTGNPVVHDGNDRVKGTKIVLNLITGKSEVSGPSQAWFFPRDTKSPNNEGAVGGSAD
ncbi:MAG TPA: LptA/OstA family protein [Candidatus Binataceae bacterium]|nr:LptA/OstA family protein [Candidatus Binataceae bacterium]